MFIYCGNSGNNRVRVFDTSDKVTEEIDKIQLKAIQSQGYKVVKDFSYDYAYKVDSYFSTYHISSDGEVFSEVELKLAEKLINTKNKYGVGLDGLIVQKSFYHYIETFHIEDMKNTVQLHCFLLAYNENNVTTINCVTVSNFGVFSCNFDLNKFVNYPEETIEFFVFYKGDMTLTVSCYIMESDVFTGELKCAEHYKIEKFCKRVTKYEE